MNKLIRIGSFISALGLFCFVAAFIAFPAMAWHRFKQALGIRDARQARRMITALQVHWSAWLFWKIHRILRIELEHEFAGVQKSQGPFIMVSNHTGMFDVLIVLWVIAAYGRTDLRWVVKRAMARAPVIGQMAKWSGNAFVARNGDPADKDAVTACADLAGEDDSSILIFPEGTRSPYHPGPPKHGGFKRVREALPHYPVLSVTIAWHPVSQDAGGRTILDGADLFGKRLFLSARVVPANQACTDGWLDAEWKRKSREIDAWRKRVFFKELTKYTPA
ncbi:1-acyl-sn-glycerol-3-phosphate acyltransferase [Candidatus Uhrbacteria bacterium]|nr:1-acyl-sn-glycerol-3-phosphate acyltransferase [Candidatus Uhrbacteria bacterium]